MDGDLDRAQAESELACQRDHRTYMPRIVLAAVHLLRKETRAACQAMQAARAINPDLSPAQVFALAGRDLGRSLLALTAHATRSS